MREEKKMSEHEKLRKKSAIEECNFFISLGALDEQTIQDVAHDYGLDVDWLKKKVGYEQV